MREKFRLLEEAFKPLGRGRHARRFWDSRGAGAARVGGVGVLSLHDKLYLDLKFILFAINPENIYSKQFFSLHIIHQLQFLLTHYATFWLNYVIGSISRQSDQWNKKLD